MCESSPEHGQGQRDSGEMCDDRWFQCAIPSGIPETFLVMDWIVWLWMVFKVGQESPWTIAFVDSTVISSESREQEEDRTGTDRISEEVEMWSKEKVKERR